MQIPFLDLSLQNDRLKMEYMEALGDVLNESNYILGERVAMFEHACCDYFGSKYSIGVANGMDAILLSLKAAGIGPGDEVIVPAHTYIATWLAVTHAGAKIVPVEPDTETFNIDAKKIEQAITKNTKAIIPVHLYGNPCDMVSIMAIANAFNLIVIEDNAQAQGADIGGKKTGTFGHFGATSLYPGKNLGALGDAGIVLTQQKTYNTSLRKLRNYGSDIKYYNDIIGYNSRLDELQAAFLSIKIKKLDEWNSERVVMASKYTLLLEKVEAIKFQRVMTNHKCVFHILCIVAEDRNALMSRLKDNGIGTLMHYPVPPHLQNVYMPLNFKRGSFPNSEKIANSCLSLPLYPGLSDDQLSFVADIIKKHYTIR
ncbi:MAG: DegT/DnrJ/EryC1/StrS family aminotransferase [Saprospiraceae bacterium]|nr:DegT/DnrJ/EryC1/StrS family aminotransferase [Saprospiraceae bacterium]